MAGWPWVGLDEKAGARGAREENLTRFAKVADGRPPPEGDRLTPLGRPDLRGCALLDPWRFWCLSFAKVTSYWPSLAPW
eukprot:7316513-Prymnesium_polylepis.1